MKTFKQLAYDVLQKAWKPLHVKDITERSLKAWLVTAGKSPWATMAALLITDINQKWDASLFVRTNPNTFWLRHIGKPIWTKQPKLLEETFSISTYITTKQKWDIAEARIAELAILYAKEWLSCYKPISDDEWVDVVLKQRGKNKAYFLQVKSNFREKITGPFTAYVPKKSLKNCEDMWIVFCIFDISMWDIWEYLRFIPATEFIKKASTIHLKSWDAYLFVAWRTRNPNNMRDQYLIDKRELWNKIIKQMKK